MWGASGEIARMMAGTIRDGAEESHDPIHIHEGHRDSKVAIQAESDGDVHIDADLPPDIDPELGADSHMPMDIDPSSGSHHGIGLVVPTRHFPYRSFRLHESLLCAHCPINCPKDLIGNAL